MKFDFEKNGDVHTRHCCISHGCKYGDNDCTVVTKKKPQEHPCETCDMLPSPEVIKVMQEQRMDLNTVKSNLAKRFGGNIYDHHSSWGNNAPPETVQITRDEFKAIVDHLQYLEGAKKMLEESADPFYRGVGIITELCKRNK